MGTARRDEPRPAVGRTESTGRSARSTRPRLRLVQRRFRYRRSQRRQDAARRAELTSVAAPLRKALQFQSGMVRFMNPSNRGTAKAVSPCAGLQIIPLAISARDQLSTRPWRQSRGFGLDVLLTAARFGATAASGSAMAASFFLRLPDTGSNIQRTGVQSTS